MLTRLLLFCTLLLPWVSMANLLVVVPLSRPPMAYDVTMTTHLITIYESVSQLPVLEYGVPYSCYTNQASIYQKGSNLILDIPCYTRISSAVM